MVIPGLLGCRCLYPSVIFSAVLVYKIPKELQGKWARRVFWAEQEKATSLLFSNEG